MKRFDCRELEMAGLYGGCDYWHDFFVLECRQVGCSITFIYYNLSDLDTHFIAALTFEGVSTFEPLELDETFSLEVVNRDCISWSELTESDDKLIVNMCFSNYGKSIVQCVCQRCYMRLIAQWDDNYRVVVRHVDVSKKDPVHTGTFQFLADALKIGATVQVLDRVHIHNGDTATVRYILWSSMEWGQQVIVQLNCESVKEYVFQSALSDIVGVQWSTMDNVTAFTFGLNDGNSEYIVCSSYTFTILSTYL